MAQQVTQGFLVPAPPPKEKENQKMEGEKGARKREIRWKHDKIWRYDRARGKVGRGRKGVTCPHLVARREKGISGGRSCRTDRRSFSHHAEALSPL